jgi:hypothetical protein
MSDLRTERHATREEVADYLREFANQLDGRGGDVGGTAAGSGSDVNDHRRREETADTAPSTDATTGTGSRSADADAVGERADADDRTGTTAHPAGKVTLLVGNDSATINPPRDVTFGVEVGSDSSLMSGDAEVVEFRMHWDANDVPEDDELRIE